MEYTINKDFKDLIRGENPSYEDFKKAFEETLNAINSEHLITIIRTFARVKPYIKFETLYNILEEFRNEKTSWRNYEIMKNWIGAEFDIFMLVNYLEEKHS